MIDLWAQYDLPVLEHLVQRLEADVASRVDTPFEVDGLDWPQTAAALRRLANAGYVRGVDTAQADYPIVVTSVSERALKAVGAWPSAEALVDRLLGALEQAEQAATTPEERTRMRRARQALVSVGRDVLVGAAGSALGGGLT
jgi:hypothetical protein